MSGHSKWATTKHKKALIDSRRAKLFAKLIKNIEVAARIGGSDLDGNPTLYDAVQKGRKSSLPNDNIERAIKRGSGQDSDAVEYQTIFYEGYGPNGIALLIECLTDNKNRAAADVRLAVTRNGGTMADPGSVSYLFSRKGVITIEKTGEASEDRILEVGLESGIEDIEERENSFVVTTDPSSMVGVRTALQSAGLEYESADVEFVPAATIEVDAETARTVFKLIDALEDSDEVQNVYSNFDISTEVLAELEA
ncbi:MAG: YebC/PmpR family DNA-binding transcriptional regulator [Actinomycetota bacterium]